MADYTITTSTRQTGSGDDLVQIVQFWDAIEITNFAETVLEVRFDGELPDDNDGDLFVPAASSKLFRGPIRNPAGVAGSTVPGLVCHRVRVVAPGDFAVEGVTP